MYMYMYMHIYIVVDCIYYLMQSYFHYNSMIRIYYTTHGGHMRIYSLIHTHTHHAHTHTHTHVYGTCIHFHSLTQTHTHDTDLIVTDHVKHMYYIMIAAPVSH